MSNYLRLLDLPKDRSFFLFGARNTGKSTLLEAQFPQASTVFINLLDPEEEERFTRAPNTLSHIVKSLPPTMTHVVLDEIQKVPKLLNVVQNLLKTTEKHFLMTGSSARKLKKGGANLLAGRAFVFHLYPLSFLEVKEDFDLNRALHWGMLPDIFHAKDDHTRQQFLQAYAHTYLREEIWEEHLIRKLDPFRKFLEVAAQSNAKIINFSKIAKDIGVDDKTVKMYFSILEDTLIGFLLEPYHNSVRKRVYKNPKFYFFDTGVTRALARMLSIPLQPKTSLYGEVFEHYVILECIKLSQYFQSEYRFTYFKEQGGAEIDLIVERPGKPLLCIEIKSAEVVDERALSQLARVTKELGPCEVVCFCNEPYPKQIGDIMVLPWQQGVKRYFADGQV